MGVHTWFFKDKDSYEELNRLLDTEQAYYEGVLNLEEDELDELLDNIKDLYDHIELGEYHDTFRVSRDLQYELITSEEECNTWLMGNKGRYVWLDDNNEEMGTELLKNFWNKHPDGVISFG